MLLMKRVFFAVCVVIFMTCLFPGRVFAAFGTQTSPKLLNLYFGWELKQEDVAALAKWDLIVLDMDQQFNAPDKIREIRRLNPRAKIIAYVNAGEIGVARGGQDPRTPGYKLFHAIPESWYVHRADGSHVVWWPGNDQVNVTNLGPLYDGKRWNTFLGDFIQRELMSSGLWDGVFLDVTFSEITSSYGTNIDLDWDGVANPPKQNDEEWQKGMIVLLKNVRAALGPDKLIMANGSAVYANMVNGVLYENFPRFGWAWPFTEFRQAIARNVNPKVTGINTNTNNVETPNNYQLMRYGLTSALMGDAYYSFDAGDRGHQRVWWYDEYEAVLGKPRGTARVIKGPVKGAYPAVWAREFERGMVIVNGTKQTQTLSLAGVYERLTGTQDPRVNNGAMETRVTIPAEDGLILLRRFEEPIIEGSAFVNGGFYQVYGVDGVRKRTGFFATRTDAASGAAVLVTDLDRDGLSDLVSAQRGEVTVTRATGQVTRFKPFGVGYTGALSLAAGQTDRDGAWELVIAPREHHQATIVITDLSGRVKRTWLGYAPLFHGGASVDVGDIDHDGLREVVTAPGFGGGPHIRSFLTDGKTWKGGFFAGDPTVYAGAFVAVGNVDGVPGDEIVVGSGIGVNPTIYVYNQYQERISRFSVPGVSVAQGVQISLTDLDGDGKEEILVLSDPF